MEEEGDAEEQSLKQEVSIAEYVSLSLLSSKQNQHHQYHKPDHTSIPALENSSIRRWMIWDEVGEDKFEREKVLLDIEQECVEAYRRKVDHANISRSRLHQELAESEAELTHLLLCLGERSVPGRPEKKEGTLREQLDAIAPALREMRLRKDERVKQDERLQKVEIYICAIRDLSATMETEASMIITKIHPSLNDLYGISKNISDDILKKLNGTVVSLEEEKQNRLEKIHHLGRALSNLWNLMDASYEDRQKFSHVIELLSFEPSDVCAPGSITSGIIQQAEAEVKRLDQLKASKTKELFLKKQKELETTCNISHMETPSTEVGDIINLVDSGEIDHVELLNAMDEKIARAKEEAASRKVIIEKVDRWMLARDEERWLEEYDQDENRYSVSRNAHRNLRRAERARKEVSKITGLVESILVKTKSWEEERQKEKEVEKLRLREKKKIIPPPVAQQDNFYVARPASSNRRISNRSINGGYGSASPLNRKLSRGFNNNTNYTALGTSLRRESSVIIKNTWP
ncbi:hypothetical protein DY000_02047168 [Brassica cretica]|uniref:65-kDa microtubule-associated protein 8 n=1 Tax=Brassica cretica TaxID=69181 RepID=A0ABQ7F6S0_BRACR|nr:hypothetical protein DY000_02047168 [Brassica cretica]